MNRKTVRAVICVILAVLMVISLLAVLIPSTPVRAVTQSEIDNLKQQQDALKAQQAQQATTIQSLRSQQADVMAQKQALDEQCSLLMQEITNVEAQIELYNNLVAEKEVELADAQAKEEAQARLFRTRVREIEENGRISYLLLILDSKDVADLLSRMDIIGEIIDYDKRLEQALIAAREEVEAAKAALEQALAEQEAKKAELEQQKAVLEQQVAEAQQLILSLESDIEANEAVYAQFEAQKQALQSQIDSKVAELRAQEEAARLAAQQQAQQTGQAVTYDPAAAVGASGSMMWPAVGHGISSPFGYRMHPIYHVQKLHTGVDINVAYGTPVYAADGGTVILAGWNGGYGNCIVINHGNGLTTLYGHMSSLVASVGQSVSKGQVIGYVGSTGASTGPHLHWEVAVNGQRVNPLNYAQ